MSVAGQGYFFTMYFPGFVCFVLYWEKISGEHLQDHWSSGLDNITDSRTELKSLTCINRRFSLVQLFMH